MAALTSTSAKPGRKQVKYKRIHKKDLTFEQGDNVSSIHLHNDTCRWLAVADLGEGFRGSEPPLNSGNNYANWLE